MNDPLAASIRVLALKLLERRDYSRFQLQQKLREKVRKNRGRFPEGNVQQAVQSVLKSLQSSGLVDDARFAANVARRGRSSRLLGNLRIKRDLKRFGIDAKIADPILSDLPDEKEALDKAIERYIRRRGRPAGLRDLQAVYRHAIRLGHRPSEVRRRLESHFRKL